MPRLLALACLVLAACPDDDPPPTPGRGYDALAYHLRAHVDDGVLIASEDITVRLAAGVQAIDLDARVQVKSVRAGERDLPFQIVDADTLRVDLASLAGGEVTFTVAYEAAPSGAFGRTGLRDDDPVRGTITFTNSEPDFGRYWLIGKHDPSDRALFSVELAVPAGQDAVANGRRVKDETAGDTRTVGYAMPDPLPTYLMAFALGDLDHVERAGTPSLALWFRKGLVTDAEAHLDMIAEQMAHFSSLLGPYPFESYAVVLIPGFPGGMENATITFNSETSGLGYFRYALNAHELAHHWFGDWVTMRTYDDVWIKEGMATLLAADAERARRDRQATGRLFGDDFEFFFADTIIDRDLVGIEKYTSGVYERAAWFISQRRAALGEEAFWAALRGVLEDHALDSVDSESFVVALGLGEDAVAELEKADLPTLDGLVTPGDTATEVHLGFTGPSFLARRVTVVDADGHIEEHELPATFSVPAGGYLDLDAHDLDPAWETIYLDDEGFAVGFGELYPLFVPTAPAAMEVFLARSVSAQERYARVDDVPADQLVAYLEAIDSLSARQRLVIDACRDPERAPLVAPYLADPPLPRYLTSAGSCAGGDLAGELETLGDADAARAEYLLSFDYGEQNFSLFSRFITSGSLRLRDLAVERLADQAQGFGPTPLPPAQRDAYVAFFRERLATTTSGYRFELVWAALLGLADGDGLILAAPLLHTVYGAPQSIVCDAYLFFQAEPERFAAFQAAAEPIDELSVELRAAFSDPATLCVPPTDG